MVLFLEQIRLETVELMISQVKPTQDHARKNFRYLKPTSLIYPPVSAINKTNRG